MVIAQALGEYGAMSAVSAAFRSALYQVESFVGGLGLKEYVFIGVAVLTLHLLFGRR